MKNVPMSRDDAENLVNLLEACDPAKVGSWRHDLAANIREVFGMVTLDQEAMLKPERKEASEAIEDLRRIIAARKRQLESQ